MLLSLEFCERNHKAAYYESKYELELQGNEGKNIGTRQAFSRIEEYAHVQLLRICDPAIVLANQGQSDLIN